MLSKICKKCGKEKLLEEFHNNAMGKHGKRSNCKICFNISQKLSSESTEGKNKKLAHGRKYYEANAEKVKQRTSAYQKANRELYNKACREWASRNPSKVVATCAKRRAAKINAKPIWADDEWDKFVVSEIYHLSSLRSKVLSTKFNVDHIVPLQSEHVCGLHCAANLQILTAKQNSSKNNLYWPDMWEKE